MDEIKFEIQGSAPEPYEAVFIRHSKTNLSASCSCIAGKNRKHCKHRTSILKGSTEGIISSNLDQVKIILSWLPGTDVDSALNNMLRLQAEKNRVDKDLAKAKKDFVKSMQD